MRRRYLIAVPILTYAAILTLAFSPLSEWMGQWISPATVVVMLMLLGPPALLLTGTQSWPVFVMFTCLIVACAGVAHATWRRSPHTETFAVWGLLALAAWVTAPWLALAIAW